VTRNGTQFQLNGHPYTFTGINIYNINSDGWCGPAMRNGPTLDQALTAIGPGKEVIRGWFFQSMAIDWATGTRDWTAFDHALNVADAHGLKVIPTLTDEWGECGSHVGGPENGTKTSQWYVDGYKNIQPGMIDSYRDWVAEVVARYKDDPRIAFWQLINESEIRYVDGSGNPLPCPSGDAPADTLKAWASDVSGLVKSIDANHLVSLGTIGNGQCGAQGAQYQSVHDIPTIDMCEYHDYGSPLTGIPGDQYNGLQVRIDQCNALNKPIFVGEAGIIPNDVGGDFQARADAFQAKINAQFAGGVRGFLAWAWSPGSTPSTLDNYDIGPGDPALASLVGRTPAPLDLGTLGGARSEAAAVNAGGQVVGYSYTNSGVPHAFSWTQAGGMIDLGTLAGRPYSQSYAVNVSGQVVGASYGGNTERHAFSWTQAGGMIDLGTLPGGTDSYPAALNDSGQVVGISGAFPNNVGRAFLWTQAGGMIDLGTLGGSSSQAEAVNTNGQVVGISETSPESPSGGENHAFSWTQAGGMVDLGTLGGLSYGLAVNGNGQVVGYSAPAGGGYHAYSWTQAGGMIDLGTLGGTNSFAYGVNDNGQVIGVSSTISGDQHAFSWTQAGGMIDLGTLGGASSEANAVNDSGLAVGESTTGGSTRAFSWTQATGMIDLGTLGGTNSYASAVNAGGQVVGYSDTTSGDQHATLWQPVSPNQEYALNVSRTGTGGGTVTSSPAGINCGTTCLASFDQGTIVALTAVSDPNSTFTGWSGEGCAGTGTCSITMSQARWVTATFIGPPNDAAGLGQFEANGTTPIALGATTDGTTVVLKGTLSDPDGGQLSLQVEVKLVGTPFDGTGLITGAPVPSGSVASASVSGLIRAKGYHWRARALDGFGDVSTNWVSFGANAESSPDFRVEAPIVFSSNRQGANNANQQEIYSMNPDGTNAIRLTTNTTIDTDPSLSPDGTKIAFQSNRDGDYEIYVMNLDGSQVLQLTTNTSADQAPAWSPDGTKIAFVSNRISNGNYDVWTMNANGTNPVRLTTVAATDNYPSWSPDGTKIAFMSLRDGDSEIFTMNANGTNQVQLTSNKRDDTFPAWSPDGTRIVFSSNRDAQNNPDIYVMNTSGSSVVRLTTKAGEDTAPAWSRDGARIVFQGIDTDGDWEIYRMPASGSALTKITNNARADVAPGW
jgi:probable HAF family extracellular repeat protein